MYGIIDSYMYNLPYTYMGSTNLLPCSVSESALFLIFFRGIDVKAFAAIWFRWRRRDWHRSEHPVWVVEIFSREVKGGFFWGWEGGRKEGRKERWRKCLGQLIQGILGFLIPIRMPLAPSSGVQSPSPPIPSSALTTGSSATTRSSKSMSSNSSFALCFPTQPSLSFAFFF